MMLFAGEAVLGMEVLFSRNALPPTLIKLSHDSLRLKLLTRLGLLEGHIFTSRVPKMQVLFSLMRGAKPLPS